MLLATVTTRVQAQYSDLYYHRVGDTIEWRSEIGYYTWWGWQELYENQLPASAYFNNAPHAWSGDLTQVSDSGILLERFYTPTPLKIIGIAGVATRGYRENVGYGQPMRWVMDTDTTSRKDYFLIYDAIGDSFPLVAQTEWTPTDTMRTLHIKLRQYPRTTNYDTTCCGGGLLMEYYLPLKEYYFDNPVYVEDSFYVGGTYFGGINNYTSPDTYYAGSSFGLFHRLCDENFQQELHDVVYPSLTNGCIPIGMPLLKFKGLVGRDVTFYDYGYFSSAPWRWFMPIEGVFIMVYPIVEVDTTVPPAWACDPIANVQVTQSGTSATVTWDGFPNYSSILLRYGKASFPQSEWTEIDVTGNTLYTLTDLQPVSFYSVTLKAECDTSKKETPWSAPVTFYVASDTSGGGTEGVDGATLLSQLTFMSPNPAKDEVTVTSSFNLTAIDIWTADGVMVYHGFRSGHDTTLDVSWLRAGTYIISIHTHNGTTHKRLIKM